MPDSPEPINGTRPGPKPGYSQLDQADWARIFVAHMRGKSPRALAAELQLTERYVRDRLRALKAIDPAVVGKRLRVALLRQMALVGSDFERGDTSEAGRRAHSITQALKAAKELGLIMHDKDQPQDADKWELGDLPDPRLELFEAIDRLSPEGGQKSLGAPTEHRAGIQTQP